MRSSATSAALSIRRGGNGSPSSGSSTPTSGLCRGVTTGGSFPSCLRTTPSRSSRSTTQTPSRTAPSRSRCRASESGDSSSSAHRPTSAFARRSTARWSGGTTRLWLATPTRRRIRRHGERRRRTRSSRIRTCTGAITRRRGGRPGRSRPRTSTSAARPEACATRTGTPRDGTGRVQLGGEQLLEARGIVERADEREVEPLVLEQITGDALDVLDGHLVEPLQQLVGLLDLTLQDLAAEAVLDRPLRALETEHEAALRVPAGFLELLRRDGLRRDL